MHTIKRRKLFHFPFFIPYLSSLCLSVFAPISMECNKFLLYAEHARTPSKSWFNVFLIHLALLQCLSRFSLVFFFLFFFSWFRVCWRATYPSKQHCTKTKRNNKNNRCIHGFHMGARSCVVVYPVSCTCTVCMYRECYHNIVAVNSEMTCFPLQKIKKKKVSQFIMNDILWSILYATHFLLCADKW